ncbi:DivIVA domain-containing protein [Cellulomonas xylanilytica]|nr:DivIVA domain-containing protein [Cellulomonas xylanilytica]
MLTAYEVLNQKFAATKFREGYDQDEVDAFLDRVTATLKELEGGETARDGVTERDIDTVRFQGTKFREGYDQGEVDDFLDRVRERLVQGPQDVVPVRDAAAPVDVSALAATALVMRLQMAHSTRPSGAPDAVAVRLPDGQLRSVVDVRSTPEGIELRLGD